MYAIRSYYETGKRGKRNGLIPFFINILTGAEGCALVNNNAAAVYLTLNTFAAGKEVIVSRGEQVQIGGGFRVPEILALSGVITSYSIHYTKLYEYAFLSP